MAERRSRQRGASGPGAPTPPPGAAEALPAGAARAGEAAFAYVAGPAADLQDATKNRLLEAAGEVFAERGFECATVRDICARAGANVAAVNYHFGDKRELYRATLFHAYRTVDEQIPIDGGAPETAPAEVRLRAFIGAFVARMTAPGRPHWHTRLTAREMADPSDALEEFVRVAIRPNFMKLAAILYDLLGPAVPFERIRLVALSIIGQCTFYRHCAPILGVISREVGDLPPGDVIAEHIYGLSLAGIREVRAELEAAAGASGETARPGSPGADASYLGAGSRDGGRAQP